MDDLSSLLHRAADHAAAYLRISVCHHATTESDVDRSLEAVLRVR